MARVDNTGRQPDFQAEFVRDALLEHLEGRGWHVHGESQGDPAKALLIRALPADFPGRPVAHEAELGKYGRQQYPSPHVFVEIPRDLPLEQVELACRVDALVEKTLYEKGPWRSEGEKVVGDEAVRLLEAVVKSRNPNRLFRDIHVRQELDRAMAFTGTESHAQLVAYAVAKRWVPPVVPLPLESRLTPLQNLAIRERFIPGLGLEGLYAAKARLRGAFPAAKAKLRAGGEVDLLIKAVQRGVLTATDLEATRSFVDERNRSRLESQRGAEGSFPGDFTPGTKVWSFLRIPGTYRFILNRGEVGSAISELVEVVTSQGGTAIHEPGDPALLRDEDILAIDASASKLGQWVGCLQVRYGLPPADLGYLARRVSSLASGIRNMRKDSEDN